MKCNANQYLPRNPPNEDNLKFLHCFCIKQTLEKWHQKFVFPCHSTLAYSLQQSILQLKSVNCVSVFIALNAFKLSVVIKIYVFVLFFQMEMYFYGIRIVQRCGEARRGIDPGSLFHCVSVWYIPLCRPLHCYVQIFCSASP